MKQTSIIELKNIESSNFQDLNGISASLVVDAQTSQLLAVDDVAISCFKLDGQCLSSIPIDELLPLDGTDWDSLVDQNDKQVRFILKSAITGLTAEVEVSAKRLIGFQRDAILLTLDFQKQNEHYRDALTGLSDRRELASRYVGLQQRNPTGLAVLFLDLANFKQVNDKFGHPAGDQVLVELARRWQACVRDEDLVARYGGDEFVVLLASVDTVEAANPVVERLTQATAEAIQIGEHSLRVGVTIGIAVSKHPHQPLADLIVAADRAMYAGKQSNR